MWQNERKLYPHSYTTWKTIYHSFVTRRMVGGGDPFYRIWNFGPTGPRWSEITDFESIFGRSALAVTPSEKVTGAFDWYRPRWPWMTLNGVIALILRFFSPKSIALQAAYVTVVENKPTISVKYCLPVPVFHFWPKLTHPAARSLCDSWASCYTWIVVSPCILM